MDGAGIRAEIRSDGTAGSTSSVPFVSVVVPHYRDLANLGRCLEALEAQTYPRDRFEIIVADNNSPEGEAAVAAVVRGRAQLVIVVERGAGLARNGGAARAVGDILAFTDADCRPEPEWIAEAIKALARHDFVGGRMTVLVGDEDHMTPEEAFERVFAFKNEFYVCRKGFTVSANLICPRATFTKVGGFLSAGVAEDCEWCYRARDKGYRIGYAANSVVGHPARRDWQELLKKWRRANGDNYSLMIQSPGGRLRWAVRILLLPASAIAHTPAVFTSRQICGLGTRLAALGVLYRIRWWRIGHSLKLLTACAHA